MRVQRALVGERAAERDRTTDRVDRGARRRRDGRHRCDVVDGDRVVPEPEPPSLSVTVTVTVYTSELVLVGLSSLYW